MEGYDVDVLTPVNNDLYCAICLKLMCNPVQFKCGHGMCMGCYKRLLNRASMQRSKNIQCPQCREIVREHETFSNIMVHRLILSTEVECPREGCMWEGELLALQEHNDTHEGSERKRKKSLTKRNSFPSSHANNNLLDLSQVIKKLDSVERRLMSRLTELEKSNLLVGQKVNTLNSVLQVCKCHRKRWIALIMLNIFVVALCAILYPAMFNSVAVKSAKTSVVKPGFTPDFVTKSSNREVSTLSSEINYLSAVLSPLATIEIESARQTMKELENEYHMFNVEQNGSIAMAKQGFNYRLNLIKEKNTQLFNNATWKSKTHEIITELKPFKTEEFHQVLKTESVLLPENADKCLSLRTKVERLLERINIFSVYKRHSGISTKARKFYAELKDLERQLLALYTHFEERENESNLRHRLNKLREHVILMSHDYFAKLTATIAYTADLSSSAATTNPLNIYDLNFIFVWRASTAEFGSLGRGEAIYSQNFAARGQGKAFLLLYHDERRGPGMLEVTYNQDVAASLLDTFTVSILNQRTHHILPCSETERGESPKDNIATVTKFFTLPLPQTALREQGFIVEDVILIMCSVD